MIILRHYGSNKYNRGLVKPICDFPPRNKPRGGLWTSPVYSEYGWRNWGTENNYGDFSSYFDIYFEGSVCQIDNIGDMENLPWIECRGMHFISFERLVYMGYDAIHLTVNGERETRYTHPKSMYGWDCETVLIMNPNAIWEN